MAAATLYRRLKKSGRSRAASRLSPPLGVDHLPAGSRIALPGASLLSLVAISCASLGLWRVGADLGYGGGFAIQDGLLSHWQVWIGAAGGMQYASRRLIRFARNTQATPSHTLVADRATLVADILMTEAAIPRGTNP